VDLHPPHAEALRDHVDGLPTLGDDGTDLVQEGAVRIPENHAWDGDRHLDGGVAGPDMDRLTALAGAARSQPRLHEQAQINRMRRR
jgi:hypothetical protein